MTGEELEALLSHLGAEREQAGEKYEVIRRKLIRLFEWRGCACPEDLADETFNRVARRMAEGIELHAADPFSYFCGVAHLVFKEVLRHSAREHAALESGDWWAGPCDEDSASDDRLEALRACLQALPHDQQRLVLQYHQEENHIRSRKDLSDEIGIPMNALRIRAHRIRRRLEECVEQKLHQPGA